MSNKLITYLSMCFLSIVILCFNDILVKAESMNNFSIEALDSEGNSESQGFYHFVEEPGATQKVFVKVANSSNEEISIKVEVNPASTNQNGIPSYLHQEMYDESLIYKISDLVHTSRERLTVPAGDSEIVEVEIQFPETDWQGDILGGIRFSQESNQPKEKTITHEVAYTIGILLNQKNAAGVENILHLNDVSVGQRNYRNYIEANLQNSAPKIVKDLAVKSEVTRSDSETVLYRSEVSNMRMAPNSNFSFGIPTGDSPIKAGNYLLKLVVVADEKEYEFTKEFSVSAQESQKLNQSAVNVSVESSKILYVILAIVGGIVLLSVLLLYKYKKEGREDK